MTVKAVGLIDTIWALVLPGAIQVFNIILLLNFYRNLPKELEESSKIDGRAISRPCGKSMRRSLPALATTGLFTIVWHWNSWFDGMILMNHPDKYPLQTFCSRLLSRWIFAF